ncbi:hypothetical protein [Hymenobacter qilianensis]
MLSTGYAAFGQLLHAYYLLPLLLIHLPAIAPVLLSKIPPKKERYITYFTYDCGKKLRHEIIDER